MAMTHKDYEILAAAIRAGYTKFPLSFSAGPVEGANVMVNTIIDYLKRTYTNFNQDIFIAFIDTQMIEKEKKEQADSARIASLVLLAQSDP